MKDKKIILKAEYGSDKTPLVIGNVEIPAYVLNNGMRVLSQNGIQKALGYIGTAGNWLPNFIERKQIKPYINSGLLQALSERVVFQRTGAGGSVSDTYGYDATILIDICDAILEAKNSGNLPESYLIYAKQAEIILRSVAKVGIIALVDEATGYQYDREKHELQAILQAFISDEILEWQKTFELSFYKEIFRLWNIPFTAANIKRKPMFIGKLTSELVYKNMPKGYFVLDNLKAKTPKTEGGNYRYRLHQSLTKESGRIALVKVINTVEALASVSDTKAKFLKLMKEKYNPDYQLKLFPELDNLAAKEDKKEAVTMTDFNKNLKGLLTVPPPKKDNP